MRHFYWIKNQQFDVLCDSWHCHDEGWCDDFGLFYAIHLWFLANKLLYTNLYLQSFDPLKSRLPHIRYNCRNKQPFAWQHCVNKQLWLVSIHFEIPPTVDCCLLSGSYESIDPCFVPSNDIVDQIWSTSVEFLEHFFAPFNTSLFLSFGQIVWDPTIAKFPYAHASDHAKSYVLLMSMPKDAWISQYIICWSRSIISRTASTLVATTDMDGRPSRNSLQRKVHAGIRQTNFKQSLDGVSSPKAKWSRSMHCFGVRLYL